MPRTGFTLGRLNVLLGALIVVIVVGSLVAPRPAERVAPAPTRIPATAGREGGAVPERPGREAPTMPLSAAPPAVVEPEPPTPLIRTQGPDTSLAREADALYRENRVGEACERYRALGAGAEVRRNLGACLARLAWEAYQANRFADAVAHYREAVEADPGVPGLWTALAIASVRAGDLSRAQAALGEALARSPDSPDALYLLGEVQERQGRTREAAETLHRLLARYPDHVRGRTLLASLEREQKVEGAYWAEQNPHFLVRYEGAAGLDVGRSVIDVLEDARDTIGRDLGVVPRDRIQVGIYASGVFGELIGAPPHLIAGAYDGRKIRLNLAASAAYSRNLSRLVRHEYTHALIHLATNGRAPIWLHEGLAQVMEPRAAPRGLDVSVSRELLTLAGIERLARTPRPEALVAGYALAHVAAEHLVERGGMAAMRAFLSRLGGGEPMPQAMRQAFGFGPEEIEARLLAVAGRS